MFEVAPAELRADGANAASDSDGCDGGEFSDEKKKLKEGCVHFGL